jgi:putative membrane protein
VLDLVLAIAHHLLIFCLFGILSCELIAVRPGMSQAAVSQIVAIDLWYGALAALILIVGFGRAVFAAKGWEYYANNEFFWAKIIVFAGIGLISVWPTIRFIRWRRAGGSPDEGDITTVRRLLYAEVILFALLPVFAAAMARGYGEL